MGEGVGVGWPGVKVCPGMDSETVDPLMKKDKLTLLHVQLALVCYVCMSVACFRLSGRVDYIQF